MGSAGEGGSVTRLPDWPQRLSEFIESRRHAPFVWGGNDCCRFAAGAVRAMTGTDPMAGYCYRDEREARALIEGAGNIESLLCERLGVPLPAVAHAMRGDVVIADLDHGPTVGVLLGRMAAYAGDTGVLLLPWQYARAAWRIC